MNKYIFIISCLFFCSATVAEISETSSVQIGKTQYLGVYDKENNQFIFRGIPYADPPIGDLRWRSPKSYQTDQKKIQTAEFQPVCMQDDGNTEWYRNVAELFGSKRSEVDSIEEMNEDCLYLNIWTDSLDESSKKPVMFWVHGGGNVNGYSNEPNYLGNKLAAKGVVVVTINYRLNAFGFMPHPAMNSDSGNYGLMDQIEALRWVQANISKFGGDPENVTFFGESAGAANLAYLIATPLAKDLFHRGISQSGAYNLAMWTTQDEGLELGKEMQTKLAANNLDEMRNASAEEVLKIATESKLSYTPSIDGSVVPDILAKRFFEQQFNNVDLMIGTNTNEWFMYLGETVNREALKQLVEYSYPEDTKSILNLLADQDPKIAMDRFETNRQMLCPSVLMAKTMSKTGNNVYQYYFSRLRNYSEKVLVYHGAEIPYMFDTHDDWLPTNLVDWELTKIMVNYWVEFARRGNPNSKENPTWLEFGKEEHYQILDIPIASSAKIEKDFCEIVINEIKQRSNSE